MTMKTTIGSMTTQSTSIRTRTTFFPVGSNRDKSSSSEENLHTDTKWNCCVSLLICGKSRRSYRNPPKCFQAPKRHKHVGNENSSRWVQNPTNDNRLAQSSFSVKNLH